MKKQILILAAMLIAMANVNATQWSVSNSGQNPGQFATINAAIASASVVNGDTLLVAATPTAYSTSFTLSKSLTIIGAGFNANKNSANVTNITGVISLTTAASGSRFYGIKHTTINNTGSPFSLNNVLFEDCYGVGDISLGGSGGWIATNLVFRNCIETSINFNIATANSAYFTNCIFTGSGASACVGNLAVNHCLFIGGNHLFQCQYAIVQNCVFHGGSIGTSGGANVINNTFNNCFFYNVTGISTLSPALPIGNGTNAQPANNGTKDSSMTSSPFSDAHTSTTLSITGSVNYHLTGAGLTYALDGGTIGVYGGNSTFSLKGEPLNSAITRNFTITNSTVPVNGNLNINLTVTKPITQ